jgi:hypothetical protein
MANAKLVSMFTEMLRQRDMQLKHEIATGTVVVLDEMLMPLRAEIEQLRRELEDRHGPETAEAKTDEGAGAAEPGRAAAAQDQGRQGSQPEEVHGAEAMKEATDETKTAAQVPQADQRGEAEA